MTYCGDTERCKSCGRFAECGGCEKCAGHPFGRNCVAERNDEFGFTFSFKRKQNFLNDKINDKIDSIDKSIMEIILENKLIIIPDLASLINKSEPTIHRHLDHLSVLNMIRRVGSRKKGNLEVLK